MQLFLVMLHGTGIRLCVGDDSEPAVGFYTSRAIRADSMEQAVHKAKALVLKEWSSTSRAAHNSGTPPSLTTEEIRIADEAELANIATSGYSFYSGE